MPQQSYFIEEGCESADTQLNHSYTLKLSLLSVIRIFHFSLFHSTPMYDLFRFNAESVQQTERRWRDGSLEEDLPMRSLSEMFNVNYFLVSQTNPHIVPALNLKKRVNRTLGDVVETEWKHRQVF